MLGTKYRFLEFGANYRLGRNEVYMEMLTGAVDTVYRFHLAFHDTMCRTIFRSTICREMVQQADSL